MAAISEFLAMGGYAAFVWPAYLLVAFGLIGIWVLSRREVRQRAAEVAALEAANPRRQARGAGNDA